VIQAIKKQQNKGKQYPPESREKIISRVSDIAAPLCEAEGIEIVNLDYQREAGGRILRLYIDKPGGVTLDDCTRISRQLSDILDVHLELAISYSLEVSSPGPDRPLGKVSDFNRFQGNMAKIRTHQAIDGQKNFTGVLLGVSEEIVRLMIDQKTVSIPFRDIHRARLVDYRGESKC
jgi:ribosome maturation factor RimP